jgi:hypothetical protein
MISLLTGKKPEKIDPSVNYGQNKFLGEVIEGLSLDSDDESKDDEIDIHEITRTGTYVEVKDAIAKDRPRLIALKDAVSELQICYSCFSYKIVSIVGSNTVALRGNS